MTVDTLQRRLEAVMLEAMPDAITWAQREMLDWMLPELVRLVREMLREERPPK